MIVAQIILGAMIVSMTILSITFLLDLMLQAKSRLTLTITMAALVAGLFCGFYLVIMNLLLLC